MRKILVAALAATSLAGCTAMNTGTSPAPLSKVAIDDRAVRYAFLTLDTLATLADAAIDAKLITPGSAKARAVANGLVRAKAAVNAASHAQRAGSLAAYNAAFDEATAAIAEVKKALGSQVTMLVPTNRVSLETAVSRLRAA